MSRIAGLFGEEIKTTSFLAGMTQYMSGPGWNQASHAEGPIALGWCGWNKPNLVIMPGVVAVLEGFIYNAADLDQRPGSDAALLAKLYQKHGFSRALSLLNGDFSAVIYDIQKGCLWLGRDRFGIRPLYYHFREGVLAFASRPGALLLLPWVSREPDRQFTALFAASHYRTIDNKPEGSPYAEIEQLPAGQWLRIGQGGLTSGTYWRLEQQPDLQPPVAELAERYKYLLLDAVDIRYSRSHNPVFTLSGGMDSSSVLSSAVLASKEKQHAVSTVYRDKTYDESEEIRPMLSEKVSQWHPVEVDDAPEVMDLVRRMVALHDEPVATATWLSHYQLCQQMADNGFASIFGGLGGDELNAGEYEYFFYHFADLVSANRKKELDQEIHFWAKYHDHPIWRKNREVAMAGIERLTDANRPGICLPDRKRMLRYASALNPEYFDFKGFTPIMDHPFGSYLKNRTLQDIYRETAPCCLRAEDRQTVAMGLDNFLPFFDHRLVEFMFRIPGDLKIKKGITKHLLRLAMKDVLPEETRTRIAKTGWNAPAHLWFTGERLDQLRDMVGSQKFRQRGIYNNVELERIMDDHQQIVISGQPRDNHMMFLWQLLNMETWLSWLESFPPPLQEDSL